MPFSHAPATRRILLIDDDVELAQMLREYLEPGHCQLSLAHSGAQGLALLAQDDYDLILLDLMLPDGNGLDLLKQYRQRSRRPVIMFTAHGGEARIVQEAIQMQTIISLVSAGMGVALVPASLRSLARTGVRYVDLQGTAPSLETGIAWRRDDITPTLERFLHIALETIGSS